MTVMPAYLQCHLGLGPRSLPQNGASSDMPRYRHFERRPLTLAPRLRTAEAVTRAHTLPGSTPIGLVSDLRDLPCEHRGARSALNVVYVLYPRTAGSRAAPTPRHRSSPSVTGDASAWWSRSSTPAWTSRPCCLRHSRHAASHPPATECSCACHSPVPAMTMRRLSTRIAPPLAAKTTETNGLLALALTPLLRSDVAATCVAGLAECRGVSSYPGLAARPLQPPCHRDSAEQLSGGRCKPCLRRTRLPRHQCVLPSSGSSSPAESSSHTSALSGRQRRLRPTHRPSED